MIVVKPGVPLPAPPKRENASAAVPKSDSGWNQRWWWNEIVPCKICHAEYLLKRGDKVFGVRTWHNDERGCVGIGSFRCLNCCLTIHFQTTLRPDGKAALPNAEVISL